MRSIQQIKEELSGLGTEELAATLEVLKEDTRTGVQSLVSRYEKQKKALQAEQARMEAMLVFERKYSDYEWIAGIDEVGRGPLAGPVVTCAAILPKDEVILYLNDSKKLSESKREALYDTLVEKCAGFGIGVVSHERIDEINILQATYEAMRISVSRLVPEPDLLLVDAVHIPDLRVKQVSIIKGDAKSASIAAASILAKVTRDRMMKEYDVIYPGYGFAENKGYGSAAHIEAIRRLGPCPIHRRSFIGNFI
ncbi:ribonuclease HII [Anaerolentibacter hominis]|uniref:ribonuclease HII n=1 Tax=Anaerolentibacter hominis TaxID=3079009 RepID=UPI0031B876AA